MRDEERETSGRGAEGENRSQDRPVRPLIGYACISTAEGGQVLDRQLDALHAAGCGRVFEDRASGARAERPGRPCCMDLV